MLIVVFVYFQVVGHPVASEVVAHNYPVGRMLKLIIFHSRLSAFPNTGNKKDFRDGNAMATDRRANGHRHM